MWKWWEYNFGQRADYRERSEQIKESLLRQFAKGSADMELVVSEIFGKGAAEARLTVEKFRQAIKAKG